MDCMAVNSIQAKRFCFDLPTAYSSSTDKSEGSCRQYIAYGFQRKSNMDSLFD